METIEELTKEIEACETSPDCSKVWTKIRRYQTQYMQLYNLCMDKYDEVRSSGAI